MALDGNVAKEVDIGTSTTWRSWDVRGGPCC